MYYLKKLFFAPFYLVSFYAILFFGKDLIENPTSLFAFSVAGYTPLIYFAVACLICSLLFIVFITLCQDWRFIGLVLLLSNGLCFLLFKSPENLILAVGFLCIGGLSYVMLDNKLKTYLTFQPTVLLSSPVRNFSKLLVLLFALALFYNMTSSTQDKPFEIPDEVFNSVSKFIPDQSSLSVPELEGTKSQLSIPKEQLELLKTNPDLLSQFGLNPNSLENLTSKPIAEASNDLIKAAVKDQVNKFIEPYKSYIPLIFALLFFISLTSLVSLGGIIIAPLLWLLFTILEKAGFTRFSKEMREVKKLVV